MFVWDEFGFSTSQLDIILDLRRLLDIGILLMSFDYFYICLFTGEVVRVDINSASDRDIGVELLIQLRQTLTLEA